MTTKEKRPLSYVSLLGFGAAVAGAAWFGSRYSPKDAKTRKWYDQLDKPSYNPPEAVFPAVWTVLYSLMAISGWRVWRSEDSAARSRALRLWFAQLATNAEWTRLFFGKRRPDRALADVLLLESMIIRYIVTADQVDHGAAMAFIPYAGWVAFATVLNADIARRNPDAAKLAA